jgi:Undecaprenyl-phosphate glucose phosphotransferase
VLLTLGLMLFDVIAINGAFAGVYLASLGMITDSGQLLPTDGESIWVYIILANLTFAFIFIVNGLYTLRRGSSRVDEAYKVVTAIALATILITLMLNVLLEEIGYEVIPWTPTVTLLTFGVAIVTTLTFRAVHREMVRRLRRQGVDARRALIVGAQEPGLAVWHTIRRSPDLGYQVQGFLSNIYPIGKVVEGVPVLGRIDQIGRVVRATGADEVVLALSQRSRQDLLDIITLADDESVSIKLYPDTFQLITSNVVSTGDYSGLPLVSVRNAALENHWNQLLKRGLDLVVSGTLLIVGSPLLLLLALIVWLDNRGPVFFFQKRVGMDGRPFYMIKFRTMRVDAEARGPGWTVQNDPRVTRFGRFLRRYSIDELPQFINVLLGEMSVVGPRPEQPEWVEQFRHQIPRYMRRHKEKAGVTGWAQVNGLRGDTSIEERTRYDLYYIENWSLLFDIKIIVRTAFDFLRGKQDNAY